MPLPKDFKRTIFTFEYNNDKYYIVETDKGLILEKDKMAEIKAQLERKEPTEGEI